MRIGAPYRCHSFVCGHILSRCRRGHRGPLLLRSSWNLRRWHLPGRPSTVRMWFAMDPWGCFDGRLTSDCPFDFCGPSSTSLCPFFLLPLPIHLSTLSRAPTTFGTSTAIAFPSIHRKSFHFWENALRDRSDLHWNFFSISRLFSGKKRDILYVDEMAVAFTKVKNSCDKIVYNWLFEIIDSHRINIELFRLHHFKHDFFSLKYLDYCDISPTTRWASLVADNNHVIYTYLPVKNYVTRICVLGSMKTRTLSWKI